MLPTIADGLQATQQFEVNAVFGRSDGGGVVCVLGKMRQAHAEAQKQMFLPANKKAKLMGWEELCVWRVDTATKR